MAFFNIPLVVSLVGFQVGWWLCVVHGATYLIALPLGWVAVQPLLLNWLRSRAAFAVREPLSLWAEYTLVLVTVVVGAAVECFFAYANIWSLPAQLSVPPLWLLVLWALLAGCIYHSFAWLMQRYLLAGVLGAIFAPLSYLAGAALNAGYELAAGWRPLLLIAGVWAGVFPLLLYIALLLTRWQRTVIHSVKG